MWKKTQISSACISNDKTHTHGWVLIILFETIEILKPF